MKKNILTILFMSFIFAMNAQTITDSTTNLKIDSSQLAHSYLKKSRHQKGGAWALLSVGFFITSLGVLGAAYQGSFTASGGPHYEDTPIIFTAVGGAMMLGSIPLFIAGHKNKHKAHLYLNSHHAMISPRIQVGRIYSVGVTVQL